MLQNPRFPAFGRPVMGPWRKSASHHVLKAIQCFNLSTLCVSTRFWWCWWWFGARRRHLEAKFHDFLKCPQITPDALQITASDSRLSTDAPRVSRHQFWDDEKIIIFPPRQTESHQDLCHKSHSDGDLWLYVMELTSLDFLMPVPCLQHRFIND